MKTYSVVFLDIDGTLLDSKCQIQPETKKLLGRLEEHGIPIILCSARGPDGIELIEKQAGLNSPIVCYGGSLVLDSERSIIGDQGIDRDTAVSFKQFTEQDFPSLTVCAYIYDIWLADDLDDPYIMMLAERNQSKAVVGSLEDALKGMAHVHKMMCLGSPKEIDRLLRIANDQFPALDLLRSGPDMLEVLAKGVSKLTAMECLSKSYNVSMEETVAMGDYYVDIDMLKNAGLGIAMGNAPEEVKQAAARVTLSNDEEGIYYALRKLRFNAPVTHI